MESASLAECRATYGNDTSSAHQCADWEGRWRELRPRTQFDLGHIAPALEGLRSELSSWPGGALSNGVDQVSEVWCYVPGSGRGYDVTWLAGLSPRHHSIGLDISPAATEAAERWSSGTNARAHFVTSDFLQLSSPPQSLPPPVKSPAPGGYSIGYDYAFLSCLHPDQRRDWALPHANQLRPGGVLVTLIFPLGEWGAGPPWAMSFDLVATLLEPVGFELIRREVVEESGEASRVGKEHLALWRKRKTKMATEEDGEL